MYLCQKTVYATALCGFRFQSHIVKWHNHVPTKMTVSVVFNLCAMKSVVFCSLFLLFCLLSLSLSLSHSFLLSATNKHVFQVWCDCSFKRMYVDINIDICTLLFVSEMYWWTVCLVLSSDRCTLGYRSSWLPSLTAPRRLCRLDSSDNDGWSVVTVIMMADQ